jgi:hypothetical protein
MHRTPRRAIGIFASLLLASLELLRLGAMDGPGYTTERVGSREGEQLTLSESRPRRDQGVL